jgi:hypothetical protein
MLTLRREIIGAEQRLRILVTLQKLNQGHYRSLDFDPTIQFTIDFEEAIMACRKNFLIALLLLASTALAQTGDSKTSIDLSQHVPKNDQNSSALPRQVALARCAYRQSEEGCSDASPDAEADKTLAQMPRRMGPMGRQGPPMRGPAYPEAWGPQFSPGHALIGAAIGFAFGAAAGSKNGVRSSFAVGTLVGLLGAGIGAGIPSFPSHYRYRRGWDDDEDASLRKPTPGKPHSPQPSKTAKVATSRPEASETYQKNDFSRR